ncbi:MAG: phosphate ABC transporter substrate-binding protein [Ignavibacteriaceae bacterium]|nr:phosphate ABC transporter substrate-binding protein [Ignavibacteriaceae bacterium]
MRWFSVSLLIVLFQLGCSFKPAEVARITIKGSDSMLPLTEKLAEEYMKQNPAISIYVYGGGSAEGIKALIRNEIDICTTSRNLEPQETKALAEYYGSVGLFYLIAKDALCLYINKRNPVKDYSIEQIKNIFECKVINWNELGWEDKEIVPVIRNLNSGTHLYFKEHVLEGAEYCNSAIVKSTTNDVIEFIEQNNNAIGYGSIGYSGDFSYARINGIEPSEKNAQNDTYPITRYLHFFTTQIPKGSVKNFVDWVLSPEGQRIVKQAGYIPLWDLTY